MIKPYVHSGNFTFPIVMNGTGANNIAGAYGITQTPTNVILDPKGKVVATFLGFDEQGIMKALHSLGIKG